jgi:hypothetical protein
VGKTRDERLYLVLLLLLFWRITEKMKQILKARDEGQSEGGSKFKNGLEWVLAREHLGRCLALVPPALHYW